MTCKLIGVTQGQWESASALDLHLWLNLTRILGRVLLSISLVPFKVEPSCKHSRRTKTTTQQLISCFTTTSASFLFQSDKILMTFTPSLLPFHLPPSPPPLHPAEPPPVLFCGFPFARSLAPFFFFFFNLIGIALFEMEKLFTLTAKAFGWRSYPEPLVMLLETMQQ